MEWHYECPECRQATVVDWDKHGHTISCTNTKRRYRCPTPATDHQAYVDTHEWPQEMEDAVYREKGRRCVIKGCGRAADTLDHTIPYSRGGKTSVENLFPMCQHHNSSKGDRTPLEWVDRD